eukprot:GILJ01001974.1.p1 GENE.GILJ01001974.1~~GILJ01001974.1.p1  ORF type:complete len:384 (+),score=50.19 GILJ01001974.1:99-1250(+)
MPLCGCKPLDADVARNFQEIVTANGYPYESHDVETSDGFILELHRIAHGKTNADQGTKGHILLAPGILADADFFVMTFADRCVSFKLADAGYDVWVMAPRGTRGSSRHRTLTPQSREYWDFSFEEMGVFDVSACVDFILKQTNATKISYLGHSQGNAQMWAGLALKPELNDKLNVILAVAPVAYTGNQTSEAISAFADSGAPRLMYENGVNEIDPTDKTKWHLLSRALTNLPLFSKVSRWMVKSIDPVLSASRRLPVYFAHFPARSSVKSILHFAQGFREKNFARFDYGSEINVLKYGTTVPPDYDLSGVSVPVVFFLGGQDKLATKEDVSLLKARLPPGIVKEQNSYPLVGHSFLSDLPASQQPFLTDLVTALNTYSKKVDV